METGRDGTRTRVRHRFVFLLQASREIIVRAERSGPVTRSCKQGEHLAELGFVVLRERQHTPRAAYGRFCLAAASYCSAAFHAARLARTCNRSLAPALEERVLPQSATKPVQRLAEGRPCVPLVQLGRRSTVASVRNSIIAVRPNRPRGRSESAREQGPGSTITRATVPGQADSPGCDAGFAWIAAGESGVRPA